MKKPHAHTALSDRVCVRKGCNNRLKMNLLTRQPDAKYCYKCWQEIIKAKKNPRG